MRLCCGVAWLRARLATTGRPWQLPPLQRRTIQLPGPPAAWCTVALCWCAACASSSVWPRAPYPSTYIPTYRILASECLSCVLCFRNSEPWGTDKLELCKIWCFHGDDYEECRLLGYKAPICTSPGTHYISATQPSQILLCKIWGFHGGDYEECRLLGCDAVWFLLFHNIPQLLVTVNVPSTPILVTLMTEAIRSSEKSVLKRATRRHIPEDDVFQYDRYSGRDLNFTFSGTRCSDDVLWTVSLFLSLHSVCQTCHSNMKSRVIAKNGVFWDVTPCDSCENRHFGGT
jgi:hypothetical protein